MAGEIVIPLRLWRHRVTNANASYDQLTMTTNAHMPDGIRCKNGEITDINFCLAYPVPSDINATPAAKIEVLWGTDSADTTNTMKLTLGVFDVTFGSTSMDSAFDESPVGSATSGGQYDENLVYLFLSAATAVTSGKQLRGRIRRDTTDAEDTLDADIVITSAFLIADKA